jgi:serine/threonine protein kinase
LTPPCRFHPAPVEIHTGIGCHIGSVVTPPPPGAPRSRRYDVVEQIGAGAAGLVFRARDRSSGEHVALKILRESDGEALRRVKAEFRALRDIVHPNLARLHHLVEGDDGSIFFTMELVAGTDFVTALGPRSGALADGAPALRAALLQLAEGLGALHGHGKLHRDVKPSNVLVEPGGRVVLLDFGGVRRLADVASGTAITVSGTFAYMAPELYSSAVTPAADWFSMGVLLYETLTGQLPWGESGASPQTAKGVPHPCALAPDAPRDLGDLALALMLPDLGARAGAAEVLAVCGSARPWRPPRVLPFVGRADELAALEQAFAALERKRPVIATVEGPSGYGKSALIENFLRPLPSERGALVLRSRCHPHESVRFEAVDGLVDELSRHLVDEPGDWPRNLPPDAAGALLRVFPVLDRVALPAPAGDALSGAEPAEVRRTAFAALRAVLARIAEHRPTVVWIDDLQWGDADSAPLLREILAGADAPGALFVFSFRSDEKAGREVLAAVESAQNEIDLDSFAILLGPLADSEAGAIARSMLAGTSAATRELLDRVVAEASGSPIFVVQLARGLARRMGGAVDARDWTLSRVVEAQLRELPAGAIALLETVAVAGAPLAQAVAVEAAGLGASGRGLVAELQHALLLRLVPTSHAPALQTFHDRIGEAVIFAMTSETLRERHRGLLDALEAQAGPDVLLRHAEGAGESSRAAAYAVDAGDRAFAGLAFGQAARFFERALELREWSALDRRQIRTKQGDSLVNAGRSGEAAPVYLDAASGAELFQRRNLQRLAAEQYMVSGRNEDGLRVLEPLLADLDLHLPQTAQSALLSTARKLAALWMRGTRGFTERHEVELGRSERTRIDVCFSAARGLIMTDTVRAGYLPLVGLDLALRAGELQRVGRSLAMVAGAVLTPFGGPLARWRDQMLAQCDEIGAKTGDAYVRASAALARGQIGIMTGDWRASLAQSELALAILRTECRGVNWEKNVAHAAELRALDELGELPEADQRARLMAAESRDLGDHYGAVVAALMLGITLIGANRPDEARRQLAAAFDGWPREPYLIQHFYRLRIEVMADLYEGSGRRAAQRLEEAWPQLERSQFLRVAATRIDAFALRARTALAVACEDGAARKANLKLATSLARRLRKETRRDARGHADLIYAGAASLTGDTAMRRRSLAEAREHFAAADMRRWASLCEKPDAFAERDVADPIAWRAMCAPGI